MGVFACKTSLCQMLKQLTFLLCASVFYSVHLVSTIKSKEDFQMIFSDTC